MWRTYRGRSSARYDTEAYTNGSRAQPRRITRRTLKNYEVAHEGKSRHAATASDRCDPMLDREANKVQHCCEVRSPPSFGTCGIRQCARADIGRVPREKRFEVLHKRDSAKASRDPFGYNFSIDAPRNFSSRELVNIRGHVDAFRVQVRSRSSAPGRGTRNEEMPAKERGCALLADRHLGLAEGVRGLLETEFEAVVVVGDEVSLFESVRQLHVALAMVDLSLRRGDGLGLIRRMRSNFPQLKLIALSVHDEKSAELAAIEAGANGFVLKRSIATDLLPTIDAVLVGSAT